MFKKLRLFYSYKYNSNGVIPIALLNLRSKFLLLLLDLKKSPLLILSPTFFLSLYKHRLTRLELKMLKNNRYNFIICCPDSVEITV